MGSDPNPQDTHLVPQKCLVGERLTHLVTSSVVSVGDHATVQEGSPQEGRLILLAHSHSLIPTTDYENAWGRGINTAF